MKKIIFLGLLFFLAVSSLFAQEEKWQEEKSTHFIIYYHNLDAEFLRQLVNKAEYYYDNITSDLGFNRFNFWLWDERAKIYVYDDPQSYILGTGQPVWSAGAVIPRSKVIYAFAGEEDFLNTILPHEMGHIIFREFVGFDNTAVPLWLDEGIASYQEQSRREAANELVKDALKEYRFIDLQDLSGISPQVMRNTASVALFYAEAVSVINYLMQVFGRDKLVLFCQYLRDYRNLQVALARAYSFADVAGLNQAWKDYLPKE